MIPQKGAKHNMESKLVPQGSVVSRLPLEGQITSHNRFHPIRYPNGRPHALAIDLLPGSDALYPVEGA